MQNVTRNTLNDCTSQHHMLNLGLNFDSTFILVFVQYCVPAEMEGLSLK
jgi:hypothetical protein